MQVLESKGIDIVRRDWCLLSREVGQKCLQEVLSGREQEDIVEVVHELLRTVAQQVNAGTVQSGKYVITKQLTKQPEDYPDAKTQAHVQVCTQSPHCQMVVRARGGKAGTRGSSVFALWGLAGRPDSR